MLEADVIVELTSVFIGSCPARRTACEQGARYLTVPGLTWTTLRPDGPFAADFPALGERAAARRAPRRRGEFQLTSARVPTSAEALTAGGPAALGHRRRAGRLRGAA